VTRRTAAEQLHAVFDGRDHADPGLLASLAIEILNERDTLAAENARMHQVLLRVDGLLYDEPIEFIYPLMRDALGALACGDVLGEKLPDAEQPTCQRVSGHDDVRHASGYLRWISRAPAPADAAPVERQRQALAGDNPEGA
jgi:hypothetical protein